MIRSRSNVSTPHGNEGAPISTVSSIMDDETMIRRVLKTESVHEDEIFISLEALLLYGCIQCGGYDTQKAEVFHRVIAPELDDIVIIIDKDIEAALRFLILTATIFEEMTRDIIANPKSKVDYPAYAKKISKYEPTVKTMVEEFQDNMFGTHYNRRNKETFIEMLGQEGWKYFSIPNLNELFYLTL